MSNDNIHLAIVKIAGMPHYAPLELPNEFKSGDTIYLHLEPTNHFDNKAVEVLWRRDKNAIPFKVGYIPKPLNQAIFALIIARCVVQAEVTKDSDKLITISISMEGLGHG